MFAALLALTGCDRHPAATVDADPALWVVRDDDTTIYLFGTVHVLRPGLSWFDEEVKQAFDRSDSLVLELILPPPAEMSALLDELGSHEGGPRLTRSLPPETAKRLEAALARLGRNGDSLDRYDPWVAALMVGNLPAQELGYSAGPGSEEVLSTAARAEGKPVIGLETAREQLGYFDSLSPGAQRTLLTSTLDGLPGGAKTLDAIIDEWAKGDANALAKRLNDDLAGSPELKQALLVNRNRHWADWIAVRLRQPGTVFVAVGAGHLAGPDSVQAELKRRGVSVARIRY